MARIPQAAKTDWSDGLERLAQRPVLLVAAATLLALVPFLGKPFNIDDPLFVWIAQHIRSHPFDPYGFKVNWYAYDWPIWDITRNPPLACYFLSLAGSLFGWSEHVLHAAILVPAIATTVGTYRLAGHLCPRPLLAAFLTLFAPVFLISSTTVMCDIPMLALWVWALVFWIEGTNRKSLWRFATAALLISLAAMTKYFGACLIPLVAVWSLGKKRPLKEWLIWLSLPVAVPLAYQFATRALYGHGLLADAGSYATKVRESSLPSNVQSLAAALTFTGGCLASATFFAPLLWTRRELLKGTVGSVIVAVVLLFIVRNNLPVKPGAAEITQIVLWIAGGISIVALAATDLYRNRDADALLLGCWLLGTFIFAAFFNWAVNGRSILPMAVPAGILVARRLDQRAKAGTTFTPMALLIPGAAAAVLALWATFADFAFATSVQTAAEAVHSAYGSSGHRLWFQGHWGFQYYMEKYGATPLDLQHLKYSEGDYVAMPSNNSNVETLKESAVEVEVISVPGRGWLTTHNEPAGASFYVSLWGLLPFDVGRAADQNVTILAFDPTGELQRTASPVERSPNSR